jgi:glycosyltransferase involved in cell wall biosynthesis
VDVLFMGLSNHWFTRSHYKWARRNKVLFVQERSEYPFIGIKGPWQKFRLWFYLRYTFRFFDAFIVITRALEEYFSKWVHKDAGIYILPMMVESDRFKDLDKRPDGLPEKYIAYVGSMEGNKDGVPILIESFARISAAHPDLHLVLIGDTGFDGFGNLQQMIEDRELSERVHFPGKLERDVLPAYLWAAEYLALARPSSKQAEGGFPNKLGEYLATGKPVIVTATGEITEYLSDGKNAFITVPDDTQAFADKLEEAINDPVSAQKIGEEGKKLADTVFHPKIQAESMLQFFRELRKVR